MGGGACQELHRVTLQWKEGGLPPETLVMRSDAPRSLPGSMDRQGEFAILQEVVARGVLTPKARFWGRDLVRPGAGSYFLDFCPGVAIGRKVVGDPSLAPARALLSTQLAGELARIHTVTPLSAPSLKIASPLGEEEDAAVAARTFLRTLLDGLSAPRPALELVDRWLGENLPTRVPRTLVHGDFRTGNFLVGEEGLRGILDWEFAHWGDPACDLGWLWVRDWRFGRLDLPTGGFGKKAEFLKAYGEAGGTAMEPGRLHFWEVMGNARWAAACVYQGQRYLSGAQRDIELLAISRRVAEMEWEALRLIEQGAR